jgi:hypothetical protein
MSYLSDCADALRWIKEERVYARTKWSTDAYDDVTRVSVLAESDRPATALPTWDFWIQQYLHRALLLGLNTPNGMQAVGKLATTAAAMLDSVGRLYGPLPAPGLPSGEIKEWE